MNSEMKSAERLPDSEVVIKFSECSNCGGFVRCAVNHMMDTKSKNEMAREAMKYNLAIKEMPLLEWREKGKIYCECN